MAHNKGALFSLSGGCMGGTGKLDSGGGRVMGDVSTVFLIETLQLYLLLRRILCLFSAVRQSFV